MCVPHHKRGMTIIGRLLLAVGCSVVLATTSRLGAQGRKAVPDARCPEPLPQPFSLVGAPTVTVRLAADGEFPDPDVTAARAIGVLMRDVLLQRTPVTLLSEIDVQRHIMPSLASANNLSGIRAGGRLLSGWVRRIGDSVTVTWSVRSAASESSTARETRRVSARIDDIARVALVLADAATQASVATSHSLATSPVSLGSVDAGEAYVVGLAEMYSIRPDELRRARTALTKASSIATSAADVWRWRARAENALIEWNRAADSSTLRGLQVTHVGSATRATQLAPRSAGAHVALADAYLAAGERDKAELEVAVATTLDADGPGVSRVSSVLSRIKGNDARALAELRAAVLMAPREVDLLFALANLARLQGENGLACNALNAAISADDELAPAYALRAIVRAELGDRRSAWADAEVATRLGHPEWGERAAAVLDARYGDRVHADVRLDAVGGLYARPTNYLDAILLALAAVATNRRDAIPSLAAAWPCKELRRGALVRDLRSIGVTVTDSCVAAASFGGTVPPAARAAPAKRRP